MYLGQRDDIEGCPGARLSCLREPIAGTGCVCQTKGSSWAVGRVVVLFDQLLYGPHCRSARSIERSLGYWSATVRCSMYRTSAGGLLYIMSTVHISNQRDSDAGQYFILMMPGMQLPCVNVLGHRSRMGSPGYTFVVRLNGIIGPHLPHNNGPNTHQQTTALSTGTATDG